MNNYFIILIYSRCINHCHLLNNGNNILYICFLNCQMYKSFLYAYNLRYRSWQIFRCKFIIKIYHIFFSIDKHKRMTFLVLSMSLLLVIKPQQTQLRFAQKMVLRVDLTAHRVSLKQSYFRSPMKWMVIHEVMETGENQNY